MEVIVISIRNINRTALFGGVLLSAGIVLPTAAQAQLQVLDNAVNLRTNQQLIGAGVGTGTKQGSSVVTVSPSQGNPVIGVGAGSGQVDHFGSRASVSVANNARLLGVDGAGGPSSPNSLSVRNPSQRPVLEPLAPTLRR
jgi:hypothetical protein